MRLKTILGKNIKFHRYRKNYTQESLAEVLHVSPNYIGRVERGQQCPSLDKIECIARILDVKPFELLLERDDYEKLPSRVNIINSKK